MRVTAGLLGLSDFEGQWTLNRQIKDHLGQMNGAMVGSATFTARADGALDYREEGTLTLADGSTFAARRFYRWCSDGAGIAVFFDDGGPFHHFRPQGVTDGTTHLCGADTYQVAYDFSNWPRWSATWQVTGPRKRYTSMSLFVPAPLA